MNALSALSTGTAPGVWGRGDGRAPHLTGLSHPLYCETTITDLLRPQPVRPQGLPYSPVSWCS